MAFCEHLSDEETKGKQQTEQESSAPFFHNDGSIIGVIVVIIGVPPRRHPAFGLPLPSRGWGSCVFLMWDFPDEG